MSNDPDHNRDRDHANDNGDHKRPGSKVAPAPARGALASLAALGAKLNAVNTTSITGRTGKPMLLFKSREGVGTWGYGQKRVIPEPGSKWAINPMMFMWGYVAFDGNKKVGEHMVPVTQTKPLITELAEGLQWQEQWSVEMKCLDGADAGVEVVHKANTEGTLSALVGMFERTRDKINDELSKQENDPAYKLDDKIAPIVLLERDSYTNREWGKTNIPLLTFVGWMSLDGPTPASKPEPDPEPKSPGPASGPQSPPEQPRRRRVA